MARNFSYSLSRAFSHLSHQNRVFINPSVFRRKIDQNNFTHGYCSSSALQTVKGNTKLAPPQFELPHELTEEIDRELVPTEDFPVYFPPTFNFAAYVDKSETLQKFVELGVDLSKIEKKKGLPQFVLKLDFNRDVKPHLVFLHDLGIQPEDFAHFLTKNPLFFKYPLEDLETRLYYLRSKKFELEQVQMIVVKDPFWLNFSTKRIDRRLGWFQKNFQLTGDDIRFLATKFPRVITSNLMHVRQNSFCIKEEMGFDKEELKVILLAVPKLFMRSKLIKFCEMTRIIFQKFPHRQGQSPRVLRLRSKPDEVFT